MYHESYPLAAPPVGYVRAAPPVAATRRKAWSRKVVTDLIRGACVLAALLASVVAIHLAGGTLGIDAATTRDVMALLPTFSVLIYLALPLADRSPLAMITPQTVAALGLAAAGAIIATLALHAAVGFQAFAHWQVFAGWLAAAFAGLAGARAAVSMAMRSAAVTERLQRRVAIYGAGDVAVRVHHALFSTQTSARLVGFYDDRVKSGRLPRLGLNVVGRLDDLIASLQRGDVDEVVIALPRSANRRVEQIAERLHNFPVDLQICTHFADDFPVISGAAEVSRVGDAGLLRLHRKPIRGWGVVAKRLEDIVLSAFFLVLLAPVMLLVALAIRLDSKGPAIFRQKRHGLINETITVYKFRSMTVTENGPDLAQAARHDPRVTKVGAFLRRTSLDELPQLWNVLCGEMSLVGPRPHAIAHNNLYGATIDRYYGRHTVRPGITGWAQVSGLRGETKDPSLMVKRVEHDLWYIQNWSLWMDIKIILMTPLRGMIHKNAY